MKSFNSEKNDLRFLLKILIIYLIYLSKKDLALNKPTIFDMP